MGSLYQEGQHCLGIPFCQARTLLELLRKLMEQRRSSTCLHHQVCDVLCNCSHPMWDKILAGQTFHQGLAVILVGEILEKIVIQGQLKWHYNQSHTTEGVTGMLAVNLGESLVSWHEGPDQSDPRLSGVAMSGIVSCHCCQYWDTSVSRTLNHLLTTHIEPLRIKLVKDCHNSQKPSYLILGK